MKQACRDESVVFFLFPIFIHMYVYISVNFLLIVYVVVNFLFQ